MRRAVILAGLLLAVAPAAHGQPDPRQTQPQPPPRQPQGLQVPELRRLPPGHAQTSFELRRRLLELDRLLAVGSLSRAESLLDELAGHASLAADLVPRRIRLAQLREDHAEAAKLCREALADQPRNANLWRELLNALVAQGRMDEARVAADSFLVSAPDLRNAAVVATEAFGPTNRPRVVVAFIDSLRTVVGDPRFLGRQRALGLVASDRGEAAAGEISAELRANPFNLALIRTELLDGPYRPADHRALVSALAARAGEPGANPSEAVLTANLHLAGGDADAALAQVRPLLAVPPGQRAVLQNALPLGRELNLLDDAGQRRATTDYLVAVLTELSGPANRDIGLRRRSADELASVGMTALDAGSLAGDPRAAAARFSALLETVRSANPASNSLYAAQIRLATFTRDDLGDPAGAAARFEAMLMNLDLPLEGVAIVRLSLGECYLAAADTARARAVLTSLGRDPDYREAAGHAHFHLARLDLAEGHFVTSRDRFAVVAMDNPAAPYANDALDLGLAIAEELDNPSGGPTLLALYARAVYFDLVSRPDSQGEALRGFITQAAALADPDEPQRLLERGCWELARLEARAGRTAQALELYARITGEHPDGRFPAAALAERARLLTADGRVAEARAALEQLLAQYPDWLFVDDAREALRSLP